VGGASFANEAEERWRPDTTARAAPCEVEGLLGRSSIGRLIAMFLMIIMERLQRLLKIYTSC
jgi:hypothetical protein